MKTISTYLWGNACALKTGFNTALLSLLLFSPKTRAQSIISSDTVMAGSSVAFNLSGPDKFSTYAWEFETNTFKLILDNPIAIPNTGNSGAQFDVASSSTMVFDNIKQGYHSFVTCASTGFENPTVQRIDFGFNPNNNNPTTVNLGNPGNAFITNSGGYHNIQDFKVVIDDSGVYHAFINNGGIVHWVFGNGTTQAPTQASRIFTNSSVLGMSMNMAVIKYNQSWYIFTGQTFGSAPGLVRFDLGSDLNNIPASIPNQIFPTISNINQLAYLAILKENDHWYITMANQNGGSNLVRFSFGTNLLNNNPIITNLGANNATSVFNRGLNFIKTCDSTTMIGILQDGSIYKYNYQNNDVSNLPVPTNLGPQFGNSVGMQCLSPYWHKDTLWALTSSYINNPGYSVYRFPLASFNSNNTVIENNNSAAFHTFNTPGVYDVHLYCDQGENKGPQSFCKQIVVKGTGTAISGVRDAHASPKVYPNPAADDLNVIIPKSGKYTLSISNILGQILFKLPQTPMDATQHFHLNMSGYKMSPGVYYVNLFDENGLRYTTKFSKK